MRRVNLLYIVEGGLFGGAEQNLLTVIRMLDKAQYNIKLCLLQPSDVFENELRDLDIPIFILYMSGKWDIFSYIKLIRFMHREKIDIVHTCLYTSNASGRIAAILARVPIIMAWEQGEVVRHHPPAGHCMVDRILAKFSDYIAACCKAAKDSIIKKENIPEHKIKVIYNCVDLSRFNISFDTSATRKKLGIKPDETLIGVVAVLSDEKKGQGYLIRAMPQIIKVYPKIKLLLVGGGPSKLYFLQIINNLNIKDKVILAGYRRDIPEIMNALDIYVCPSLRETFSLSVLEAMSSKKPVIATHLGGMPEMIIENQTGYLIPPKDVDSIVRAVINLLSDREKMRRMGEAGFERVRTHFSSELIIKEVEAVYKELSWKIHPKFR